MDKYELDEKIAKTEHLVEADSFASMCLWERWAADSKRSGEDAFTWKQHNFGTSLEIGRLDDRPVMLTLFWNTIGGALVCFWCSESQVTDYKMVREFLTEKFPGVPNRDAMNFHNVVLDIHGRDSEPVELVEGGRPLGRETVELFRERGILTTRACEMALLAKERGEEGADEVHAAVESLSHQGERFQKLVWASWLKSYYDAASVSGHEGTAGSLNVLVYGLAGRVMVMLQFHSDEDSTEAEKDYYVSLLGYDGKNGDRMYLCGAYGKATVLETMIEEAILHRDSLQADIHPNADVRLAI